MSRIEDDHEASLQDFLKSQEEPDPIKWSQRLADWWEPGGREWTIIICLFFTGVNVIHCYMDEEWDQATFWLLLNYIVLQMMDPGLESISLKKTKNEEGP